LVLDWTIWRPLCLCYCNCRKSKRDAEDEEGEDDEDDEDKEEEESEEEESDEEEAPAGASQQQQELSRADRKALKKQGKKKETAEGEDEDDDPLLANPNRTVGRMKISDLNASREPTRKERWKTVSPLIVVLSLTEIAHREAKEKAEAKAKYLKVSTGNPPKNLPVFSVGRWLGSV
jgi:hypothetical protein